MGCPLTAKVTRCLVMALLLWPLLPRPGVAQEPLALVRLEPEYQQIEVGEIVEVRVMLDDVEDLYGIEFRIRFDPTFVWVVDVDPAETGVQIALGDFPSPDFVSRNEADNVAGRIRYAVTQMWPSEPRSGSGWVATIRLWGRSRGTSWLTFEDVLLSDSGGIDLAVDTLDGEVYVADNPTPIPAPPTYTPAPATATFTPSPSPTWTALPEGEATGAVPSGRTGREGSHPTPTATWTMTPSQTQGGATATRSPTPLPTATATYAAYPQPQATPTTPYATPAVVPTATARASPAAYPVATSGPMATAELMPTRAQIGPSPTQVRSESSPLTPATPGVTALPPGEVGTATSPSLPTAVDEQRMTEITATATVAQVAALLPTPAQTAAPPPAQRVCQRPLVPLEMFSCGVVLLIVFTFALGFYLVLGQRPGR